MPGYFTNLSAFDPVSYEQFVDAAETATDAHRDLENKYATYRSGMKQLAQMIDRNKESDKAIVSSYDDYLKELERVTGDLSERGLTRANQAALTNLTADYAGLSTGIEGAYNARKAMIDDLAQRRLDDSSLEFSYDPSSAGLADFWNGRTPIVNSISGNDMYTRAAALAANISQNMDLQNSTVNIGGMPYMLQHTGFTMDDITRFLNDRNSVPQLNAVVDQLIGKDANVFNSLSKDQQSRLLQRINEGIMAGFSNTNEYTPLMTGSGSGGSGGSGGSDDKYDLLGSGLDAIQSASYTVKNPFRNAEWDRALGIQRGPAGWFAKDVTADQITEDWIKEKFGANSSITPDMLKRYLDDKIYESATFNLNDIIKGDSRNRFALSEYGQNYYNNNGKEKRNIAKDFDMSKAIPYYDTRSNSLFFQDPQTGNYYKANTDQVVSINSTMSKLEDFLYNTSSTQEDIGNGLIVERDKDGTINLLTTTGQPLALNIGADNRNNLRYTILSRLFAGNS